MRERAGTRASAGWIKRRAAVSRLKLDLADAETKRDALQKELAAVPATLSVEPAPQVIVTGGRLTPIDERLQEVRRNLDSLLLKYTENHPDVKSAREAIAQLEAERRKSSGGPDAAAKKGEIANPVYEQIKVRVVDAEAAACSGGSTERDPNKSGSKKSRLR